MCSRCHKSSAAQFVLSSVCCREQKAAPELAICNPLSAASPLVPCRRVILPGPAALSPPRKRCSSQSQWPSVCAWKHPEGRTACDLLAVCIDVYAIAAQHCSLSQLILVNFNMLCDRCCRGVLLAQAGWWHSTCFLRYCCTVLLLTLNRKFSGFRSRCTTFMLWQCCTTWGREQGAITAS